MGLAELSTFVLVSYFSILAILCVFGAHRFLITRLYRRHAKKVYSPKAQFDELPMVTIQLPVFNEKFVIERLIDASIQMNYPKDKLEIQVLDDSTDDTCELARQSVEAYQAQGYDIHYIHRTDRTGYKAGALENGLKTAKGEFVAIFDADFIPNPEFLMGTVHYFTDEKVGMVQARWEHLNRPDNTLTQVQAIMLDAHFIIEHGGRCYGGLFFNFNGTAGIWRRQAIDEAGGWQHDTLTEDLDLSYRAQMKGWRFLFIPNLTCPAELPNSVTAFKSQQHRWAKGAIQVALKLLPRILKSRLPFSVKVEAFFHLAGNLAYLLMIINSIFFVIPSMMLRHGQDWWTILFIDGPLFLMASISFVYFYLSSQHAIFDTVKGRKRYIPALMAIGIGLGVNNTRAVCEALLGRKSGFVRTPKSGERQKPKKSLAPVNASSYRLPRSPWGYLEIFLGFLYSVGIVWAIISGNWASIPFLVLFQNGFYFIGWMTVLEERAAHKAKQVNSDPTLLAA